MKKFLLVCVAVMLATPAFAIDLSAARSQGLVGEKLTGYVAAVKPDAAVNALVADVNTKRRGEYERIAKEKGQSADVVAKVAAESIISGLPAGSLYEKPGGGWAKR